MTDAVRLPVLAGTQVAELVTLAGFAEHQGAYPISLLAGLVMCDDYLKHAQVSEVCGAFFTESLSGENWEVDWQKDVIGVGDGRRGHVALCFIHSWHMPTGMAIAMYKQIATRSRVMPLEDKSRWSVRRLLVDVDVRTLKKGTELDAVHMQKLLALAGEERVRRALGHFGEASQLFVPAEHAERHLYARAAVAMSSVLSKRSAA